MDWESGISKAKHSLGTCYLKLRMTEESEKYLTEDLIFCRQNRSRAKLNTEYELVFAYHPVVIFKLVLPKDRRIYH